MVVPVANPTSSCVLYMLVRLARLTQPNFKALAASRGRAQLLTIPYSHFCEFGAWSLRAASVPFDEHGFGPGGNVLPLVRLRLGDSERHVSTTSAVSMPSGEDETDVAVRGKRAGGSVTAVPACVLPDGRVLVDSWSIAEHACAFAGLEPVPSQLKRCLDTRLGVLTRQLTYAYLLRPSNARVWNGLILDGGSVAWRAAWWAGGSRLTERMTRTFSADDPEAIALCRYRLREIFAQLDADFGIGGLGSRFLGGADEPGMADIALASLTAPIVLPEAYCEGRFNRWFFALCEQDPSLREEVASWRETPVGSHTLKVYEVCRFKPLGR